MKINKGVSTSNNAFDEIDIFQALQMDERGQRERLIKLHSLCLEKKRRLSRQSLYYFCKYILGFKDMQLQPHWELCQFLEKYGHKSDCLILCPRGTFKSSVTSIGYPMWRWLHDRNLRALLSSAELSNSRGFLGLIRQNIELNRDFRELFGKWDENSGQTWHSSALSLAGRTKLKAENSLTASSVDVTKVSQHYDYAILDDLQTDKNVTSKELIDKIQHYLQLLIPILDPSAETVSQGPRIIVGTRWHFDDIYGRLIAHEKRSRREGNPPALRMLVRKAVTKDKEGKTSYYFPTRFNGDYLKKIKESSGMSNYHFSCQYLNDPLPDEAVIFAAKYVNYFQVRPDGTAITKGWVSTGDPQHPHLMTVRTNRVELHHNYFTLVDPSVGEHSDSDYFAFDTVGVDGNFNIFVWDVRRKHFQGDTTAVIDEFFDVHHTYHPIRMGVEAIAFQKYLIWSFQEACRVRGQYLPIEELKTDNTITKEMRIRGFQPYWKARRVYLRVTPDVDMDSTPIDELRYSLMPDQDVLLDEAERFPLGATKDCLDALAYAPQLIFPAELEKQKQVVPGSYEWLEQQMDRNEGRGLSAW